VVVWGLLFSQLVTLYLTPVVYIYMSAAQTRVQQWKKRGRRVAPEAASVVG
jgi:HAE1 family hydrophobic/amphiphilic exporter-1